MITCHLLNGEFSKEEFDDFTPIVDVINQNRRALQEMPFDAVIDLLVKLGRKIIQNPEINTLQGVSYISLWLRRKNLEQIGKTNYGDCRYLDTFVPVDNHVALSAQPRGVVCQWVATNVPTLAFFSLAQAILSKNGSIAKVPEENSAFILALLKELSTISTSSNGVTYHGRDIVRAISLVSFEGRNPEISRMFSLIADCKVIYGGSEAIRSILALPQKDHCETIVFGPKYSFSVFDRAYIESERFEKALENSVKDIAVFNQMACSSPQVLFFEKSRYSLEEIGSKMKGYFEQLPPLLRHQDTDSAILANTINMRSRFLLSDHQNIIVPDDLGWTILMDTTTRLEDPIHGKCIFIKEIESVNNVFDLITRKIQAVTVCIGDEEKRCSFAREATYRGVDRIVVPGATHDYDQPWDGILPLSRLVRWVILKSES
ncbi:acyl-CoA reductase [Methanofollis formosanus]|uniref:Acyl-CoA reductase n=1 Tax=Methanofollis formosanus TaxID=299308 RepID=A0A8G1A2M0_9EURY|nr:acyl-CoA reductase [Methanofollis formosanus]QYZ79896.1 acyl-CoA reductase [Methanofollis formosanus]